MLDLTARASGQEIMDDFTLPSAEVDPVLEGLAKMNAWFGGHETLIKALKTFPVKNGDSISDWGCGGGDTLKAVAIWARRKRINVKLTGIDCSPAVVQYARRECAAFPNIHFLQQDVMSDDLQKDQFDIVISSLFTHHFADDDWVQLICKMHQTAKRGVIITDLHRHWLLYVAVVAITRLLTRSKMARYDGPLSVKRAFTRKELVHLLQRAEIGNYKLTWEWAFRWKIIIYK